MELIEILRRQNILMKGRLKEIMSENDQSDVLANAEHYQNQLIIQKNNIDELAHTIKITEDVLEKEANKNPAAVDYIEMRPQSVEKEAIDLLKKRY